jgi:hypothetical protein
MVTLVVATLSVATIAFVLQNDKAGTWAAKSSASAVKAKRADAAH